MSVGAAKAGRSGAGTAPGAAVVGIGALAPLAMPGVKRLRKEPAKARAQLALEQA